MKIEKANQLDISQINSNQNTQKKDKNESIANDAVFSIDKTSRKTGVFGDATYEKPAKEEKDALQNIENQAGILDATQMKNEMVVASNTTSEEDCDKMQEEGFSLQSTKIETVVTVTDKIKMQLAKAGADISSFGDGLSEAQLEKMTGNAELAQQLAQTIAQADLPVTADNLQDSLEAVSMAGELTPPTDGAIKYMLDNSLEPTIENLYKAEYSGSASYQTPRDNSTDYEQLMPQITEVIGQSGMEVTDASIEGSKWLIANNIPLTAGNLSYLTELQSLELPLSDEQVMTAAVQTIAEGNRPQQAMLVSGYSLADQADHAIDVINNTTDAELSYLVDQGMELTIENLETAKNAVSTGIYAEDTAELSATGLTLLTARRQLEETRLAMTAQANYTLLKQGISIDTKPLAELVEDLKAQENSYYQNLLTQDGIEASAENVKNFRSTIETVTELKTMPAYALGTKNADTATLSGLHEAGQILKDTFEKAGQSYETMKTAVRSDLGDSIQKAFSNVDDILTDLGMDTSNSNERAVRILAYNGQEITEESITKIKAADEEVQRAFKNLSPSVVREMIKTGENPLDSTMTELNEKAVQIKKELGVEDEERFSKYLYKLDQSNEITDEERSSYIGIYRLINQVEKPDGAAGGALIAQGGEMTMRNLLTQVRSAKHGSMDYTVDEDFGGISTVEDDGLSITEQIEKGYQTNCIHDVLDSMTPHRMKKLIQDDDWQSLSPEQLSDVLASSDDDTEADEAYARMQLSDLATCKEASEEAYQMLADSKMPNTIQNVMAASELIRNRNAAFKKFFQENTERTDGEEDIDLASVKQDMLERFGEAVKTPEDMAKAQKALADTAENVMKTMITESRDVNSLDIRSMKLLNAQIALGTAGTKEENYAIPVLVGDEVTNVSLKIVRGKEKKGLVDVLFSTDGLGKVAAQLKASADGISGYVASDRTSTTEWLESNRETLVSALQQEEEGSADIGFFTSESLNLNQFGRMDKTEATMSEADTSDETSVSGQGSRIVQTKTLYHMAEAFLKTVKELAAKEMGADEINS